MNADSTNNTRALNVGEIIKSGDEYLDPHNGKWYPSHCVGVKAGTPNLTSLEYRRHVAANATKRQGSAQ